MCIGRLIDFILGAMHHIINQFRDLLAHPYPSAILVEVTACLWKLASSVIHGLAKAGADENHYSLLLRFPSA